MKNFKKLLVFAFALVVAATIGVSTSAEAARRITGVKVTNSVTVRPAAANIELAQWGKTTLKTSSKPSIKPTFTSSNKAVATVNKNGVITARKKGVAKIKVKFAKKGYATVTKTITVRVKSGKVTKITVSAGNVAVGGKTTAKATVKATKSDANKTVKWGSLNPSIATVDSKTGVITGKKTGKATIVAKATDGKGATCKKTVTVKNRVTSVALKSGYPTVMVVGQTYYNFAAVTNSDAFDTRANLIVDSTSNKAIATVTRRGKGNNFTVKALKKGDLVLYVRSNSKNPNGKYAYSKKVTIKVVDPDVVKVDPKAGTTATATVTGNPKAIAQDLESALYEAGAKVNNIEVSIDGVKKTVSYDGKKVMVGNTWLGDVETRTGKVSVTITENFASYVQDMDVFAAFMDGKEYNYTVKVGKNTFTSLKSDSGIYVVATVNGTSYKMYNEGKTLYIVGTVESLGDLANDLGKVATLTNVNNRPAK